MWRFRRTLNETNISAFMDGYEALCKKHKLSLSHEDGHGAFLIQDFDPENVKWVRNAQALIAATPLPPSPVVMETRW